MTYGLDVSKETDENFYGVPENFTIFTGEDRLKKDYILNSGTVYRFPWNQQGRILVWNDQRLLTEY